MNPTQRVAQVLVLLAGCGAAEAPPVPSGVDPGRLETKTSNYPAFEVTSPGVRPDGLQGVVKVVVEHHLESADGTSASFVAQGAGSLVIDGPDWLVVTARHLVVPDPTLRKVTNPATGSEVTLDDVARVRSEIRLGSIGIEPASLRIHATEDAAVLEVAADRRGILSQSVFEDAARPILAASNGAAAAGRDTEAWGFPTGHLPQVEKLAISAVQPGYVALNQALSRGFSGGPVLVASGESKRVLGIVTRADEQLDQTTVLYWSVAEQVMAAQGGTVRVASGETVEFARTPFTLGAEWPPKASGTGEAGAAEDGLDLPR